MVIGTLCERLKVTKGSFYWHFEDRAALLAAVLEEWQRRGTERVIETTDAARPDPAGRLWELAQSTFGASTMWDALEFEVRAWARVDDEAAKVVRRVDEQRLDYVRRLLRAAGASPAVARHRAALLYRTLVGEFTWRRHGGEQLSKPAQRELYRWLVGDLRRK